MTAKNITQQEMEQAVSSDQALCSLVNKAPCIMGCHLQMTILKDPWKKTQFNYKIVSSCLIPQ